MATNDNGVIVNGSGNVMLIDTNLVNVNPGLVNAIPQYQDMYISAELTAKQRGRTVLETNNSGLYSFARGNSNDDIAINFIGNNQEIDNPNYLNFTTNWYDNDREHQTEGFGISSIKVWDTTGSTGSYSSTTTHHRQRTSHCICSLSQVNSAEGWDRAIGWYTQHLGATTGSSAQ